jgi:hypothetical protein
MLVKFMRTVSTFIEQERFVLQVKYLPLKNMNMVNLFLPTLQGGHVEIIYILAYDAITCNKTKIQVSSTEGGPSNAQNVIPRKDLLDLESKWCESRSESTAFPFFLPKQGSENSAHLNQLF